MSEKLRRQPLWIITLGIGWLIGSNFTGCGKKPAPPPETGAAEDSETEHPDDASHGKDAVAHDSSARSKPKKAKGPEIGGIPLDVWFDDPLAIAANAAPVGGAAAPAKPAPAAGGADKGDAKMAAADAKPADAGAAVAAKPAGKDDGWKGLISGEEIVEETKAIKLKLTDALSTVGKYNGNYKEVVQVDAAELAALAGIAISHPDPVGWKENAKYVRDLASEVSKTAKGLGEKDYAATKIPFDKLGDVLSGNKPAGLEEAAPALPFNELFSRRPIMKRMERAYQFLKAGISNEAAFKKEKDKVIRECTVLGVLSKVAGAEGYTSTDEEDYQKYIKTMVDSSLKMVDAAKNDNFAGFSDALGKVQKSCDECHLNYKMSN